MSISWLLNSFTFLAKTQCVELPCFGGFYTWQFSVIRFGIGREVCFSYVKLVNSHCERRCPHSRLPLLEEFDLKIDSYETVQAHIFLRKLYVSPDHSYLSLKTAHLYLHWRAFPIVRDYKNAYENCESSCSRHWYK